MRRPATIAGTVLALGCAAFASADLQDTVDAILSGKGAAALAMRVDSGQLLAVHRRGTMAWRTAAPGSTVKPFVLLELLRSGRVSAGERIACPRKLKIGRRTLDCTHPPLAAPLDAAAALAFSCNFYFAMLATRLEPAELRQALLRAGLASATGLVPREAVGRVGLPATLEARQLLALGETQIEVTPLELLNAYRRLALMRRNGPSSPALATIFRGLEDSVEFGMASLAAQTEIKIAGKTGTSPALAGTHGWFAGFAPADQPEVAVVVYLERGRGRDAAALAGRIFAAWTHTRGRP